MNTPNSMSEQYRRLYLEVAWEIDALARVLPGLVPPTEDNGAHFVVRAMAGRLLRLSGVLLGADDDEAVGDLMQTLTLDGGQG